MNHQNKPTAPITYLTTQGKTIEVPGENDPRKDLLPLHVTLHELAILQTLANRSLFNCNCNLNKDVLKSIVGKIKEVIITIGKNDGN